MSDAHSGGRLLLLCHVLRTCRMPIRAGVYYYIICLLIFYTIQERYHITASSAISEVRLSAVSNCCRRTYAVRLIVH